MQQLRERGVYSLPEGGEFVAHAVLPGGYVLYTPGAWEFFGIHACESDGKGTIHLRVRSIRLSRLKASRTIHSFHSRRYALLFPFPWHPIPRQVKLRHRSSK